MNPLNGLTLTQARKVLSKGILSLIGGLYRDEFWSGPKKVWDYLGNSDIDYTVNNSQYRKDRDNPLGPDTSKEWYIEFPFVDANGKERVIKGILTAHGAGTVKSPLDAYDMTASIF